MSGEAARMAGDGDDDDHGANQGVALNAPGSGRNDGVAPDGGAVAGMTETANMLPGQPSSATLNRVMREYMLGLIEQGQAFCDSQHRVLASMREEYTELLDEHDRLLEEEDQLILAYDRVQRRKKKASRERRQQQQPHPSDQPATDIPTHTGSAGGRQRSKKGKKAKAEHTASNKHARRGDDAESRGKVEATPQDHGATTTAPAKSDGISPFSDNHGSSPGITPDTPSFFAPKGVQPQVKKQ